MRAIGASAAADATAQAIPSPVNGSTYPAASPTANHRRPATATGLRVRAGVPFHGRPASPGTAGQPTDARIASAAGPSPPADFTKPGSSAAATSSRSSSTRTSPTYPPRPVAM